MPASSSDERDPKSTAPQQDGGQGSSSGPQPRVTRERTVSSSAAGVDGIVKEIREGLVDISSRELELRRREQAVARQFREMKQSARTEVLAEQEKTRKRLAAHASELNTRATELGVQRDRLERLSGELKRREVELESQRHDLILRTERARQQAEAQREKHREQRQMLRERIAAVREYEEKLKERVRATQTELVKQRQELDERETRLEQQTGLVVKAKRGLLNRQVALERKVAEGESLAGNVREERAQLAVEQERLQALKTEIEQAQQEIEQQRDKLQRDWQLLDDASSELEDERQRIAKTESDLRNMHEVLKSQRTQLRERQAELARAEAAVTADRELIAAERQRLEDTATELDAERGQLAAQRREVESTGRKLADEHTELRRERQRLEALALELESAQSELANKQQKLDEHWQQQSGTRHDLDHEIEQCDARRRDLQRREAELGQLQQRLDKRDQRLAEERAALESAQADLQRRSTELDQRAAALQNERDALGQMQSEAQRQREQAEALQVQADERENEVRQAALSLELEQRNLHHAQQELDRSQEELAQLRKQHVANAKHSRRAPEQPEAKPAPVSPPPLPTPRRWLRCAVLALIVGLVSAAAWFATHPKQYRAISALRIDPAPADPRAAAAFHRQNLLSDTLLADAGFSGPIVSNWQVAIGDGRVRVVPVPGQPATLRIAVTTPQPAQARRLVDAAGEAYDHQLRNTPLVAVDVAARERVTAELKRVTNQLDEARAQAAELRKATPDVPDPNARATLAAELQQMQAQRAAAGQTLESLRAELAGLLAMDTPRGSVAPEQIADALAADEIYQEDRKEYHAVAMQFRSELAVAMLQLIDPAKALHNAVHQFADVLQNQEQLEPPTEIRAVLEECRSQITPFVARTQQFHTQWRQSIATIRNMDVRDNVVRLVERQNEVADRARRLADALGRSIAAIDARIDQLASEGDGSTREVVVSAVLRSEQQRLQQSLAGFAGVAQKLSLTQNIELDAHDRKLRGLRMRLTDREQAVEQQLQAAADHAARETHVAEIAGVRERLRETEQTREQTMTAMLHAMDTLREMDAATRQHQTRAQRLTQQQEKVTWLAERQAELTAELDRLDESSTTPTHVTFDAAQVETLGAAEQIRGTALAGAGGFLATWVVGAALLVGRTAKTRRRHLN